MKRGTSIAASALGVAAAFGIGYVAKEWRGYGRRPVEGVTDGLLDRVMPMYEVTERHETPVSAPAATTFATVCELDFRGSPLVRALFRVRRLVLEGQGSEPPAMRIALPELQEMGWRVLAEDPGREVVLGAITQPWVVDPRFRGAPADEFMTFAEPGYVKIAWTLAAEPIGPDTSLFRTETRVMTTDDEAHRRFRRYWVTFAPGIRLVRRALLRAVRTEAERRHRVAKGAG